MFVKVIYNGIYVIFSTSPYEINVILLNNIIL